MKTAYSLSKDCQASCTHLDHGSCRNCVEEALTQYAEERIRKAVIDSFGPEYRKIRAEALEEAAKIHHVALQVWCATQFPEECTKADRTQADSLKNDHGGTLGFIAYSEASMRALSKKGE